MTLMLMQTNRFRDLLTHRKDRIERGHRFLENHGDFSTTNATHGGLICLDQIERAVITALKLHAAGDDTAATMFDQTHDRQRRYRLART